MAGKREREQRQKRVVDAGRRLAEHTTGSMALNVPRGLTQWNPKKDGAYEIDLIPYEVGKSSERYKKNYADPGDLYYERTYFAHFGIGPDNDAVVCRARTFGEPCPVCERRNKMADDPKYGDAEIKALFPKERQLFLVYDHNDKGKGLQLWDVSNWNFGKQLDAKINNAPDKRKAKYRRFADPEEGLSLRLVATEESMGDRGRKFLKFGVDEFMEREESVPEKVMNHTFCLDDVPVAMTYAEVKKLFLQIDDGKEDAEDDSDGPNTKPSRNGSRAEADDDDDPDEDDVEWKKGDVVKFQYKGKVLTGKIETVNEDKGIAGVRTSPKNLQYVDLDELSAATADPDDDDSDDEDPDDDPPPKKGGKKTPTTDDDDDDPDDSDLEEEDEVEVAPRGKKGAKAPPKKKSRWSDDDDEDSDDAFEDDEEETDETDSDDDEEDEEDEPPPKKRGRPAGKGKR